MSGYISFPAGHPGRLFSPFCLRLVAGWGIFILGRVDEMWITPIVILLLYYLASSRWNQFTLAVTRRWS